MTVISKICQEYIDTNVSIDDLISKITIENEYINIEMIRDILCKLKDLKLTNQQYTVTVGWSYNVAILDTNKKIEETKLVFDNFINNEMQREEQTCFHNRIDNLTDGVKSITINTPPSKILHSIDIKEEEKQDPNSYVYTFSIYPKWMCPNYYWNFNVVVTDIIFRIRYSDKIFKNNKDNEDNEDNTITSTNTIPTINNKTFHDNTKIFVIGRDID